ncbi:TATA-binding protein [Cryptosporidium ryanae]|uniref:TATA-binding protein n=1 Tax=Cryptosporidium ryanae TaxID=515981 RepID=UPI00351A7085|nr:TATA-binding protein [Cryptosporidium ryanae]
MSGVISDLVREGGDYIRTIDNNMIKEGDLLFEGVGGEDHRSDNNQVALCNSSALLGFGNSELEEVPSPIVSKTIVPEIQNIIASVHLKCELDLRLIAISARNAEYNPKKVNAVVMRLREPKCTGLLFRSGRLMITGARMEDDAKLGGKKMAKICQKSGFPRVKFANFKMENIIATADCKFPIRLEGLAYDHRDFCNYEPELFPGLVYRYHPDNSPTKAVLLLFVSGKVIVTGCKNYKEICTVFDNIYPVLCQYKK